MSLNETNDKMGIFLNYFIEEMYEFTDECVGYYDFLLERKDMTINEAMSTLIKEVVLTGNLEILDMNINDYVNEKSWKIKKELINEDNKNEGDIEHE